MSKRYYIEGETRWVPQFEPAIDSKPLLINYVCDPYRAVINGHETALAGCDQQQCDQRAYCLRADPKLKSRVTVKRAADHCTSFIPVTRVDV